MMLAQETVVEVSEEEEDEEWGTDTQGTERTDSSNKVSWPSSMCSGMHGCRVKRCNKTKCECVFMCVCVCVCVCLFSCVFLCLCLCFCDGQESVCVAPLLILRGLKCLSP